MPLGMFVNPLPTLKAEHLLQFDFPCDAKDPYCAPNAYQNIDLSAPGIEQLYGLLGTPKKEQGHPFICEASPLEPEDPNVAPYQDQVIDIDRRAVICHTGRLSGSMVRFLACDHIQSIVKVVAQPLTFNGPVVEIKKLTSTLAPQAPAPNVWFWKNPKTRDELLYTVRVDFHPGDIGAVSLEPENVYKLVLRWEFYDLGSNCKDRLPISGFDETVSFEVIKQTANL